MNRIRKWTLGTIGTAALVAAALSGGAVYAQSAAPVSPLAPPSAIQQPANSQAGPQSDQETALAKALGITVEKLQTAEQTASTAALAQAVKDGKITQAQADQMLQMKGPGGRGFGPNADSQYLADALGITLDQLQAAQDQVQADRLAQAVTDGKLTQAQADEITARQKLQRYLADKMQAAYAAGVKQAVADGVITQAQADQFVKEFHWDSHAGMPMGVGPGGPNGGPGQAGLPPGGALPAGAPSGAPSTTAPAQP